MSSSYDQLRGVLEGLGLPPECLEPVHHNPSGLPSAWMSLPAPADLRRTLTALQAKGARLATTTVFRPDPHGAPGLHHIKYHMILNELPISITVELAEGAELPSVTDMFPNADWEEREMMELTGITVTGHPNPRRLLLDERLDAGIFDRLVPYSEMTNSVDHEAIWQRIRDESCEAEKRRQERKEREAKGVST